MHKTSIKTIVIRTPYIQLGQLLKIVGVIQTGGETKHFLLNNHVLINEVQDQRRGRKLYPGDRVMIQNEQFLIETQ
jgi:ribosome-associated protein